MTKLEVNQPSFALFLVIFKSIALKTRLYPKYAQIAHRLLCSVDGIVQESNCCNARCRLIHSSSKCQLCGVFYDGSLTLIGKSSTQAQYHNFPRNSTLHSINVKFICLNGKPPQCSSSSKLDMVALYVHPFLRLIRKQRREAGDSDAVTVSLINVIHFLNFQKHPCQLLLPKKIHLS